jgi:hypothetical protein
LWKLHGITANVTAAIWRNDFGLELRIEHGDELLESRLSRYGEAPLLLIADQLKANLLAQDGSRVPHRRWTGDPAVDHRLAKTADAWCCWLM